MGTPPHPWGGCSSDWWFSLQESSFLYQEQTSPVATHHLHVAPSKKSQGALHTKSTWWGQPWAFTESELSRGLRWGGSYTVCSAYSCSLKVNLDTYRQKSNVPDGKYLCSPETRPSPSQSSFTISTSLFPCCLKKKQKKKQNPSTLCFPSFMNRWLFIIWDFKIILISNKTSETSASQSDKLNG